MSRHTHIGGAILCLVVGTALEIMPLPDLLQAVRPPLPLMILIYWALMWPERLGLGAAFVIGIALDILHGQLLGQNAFAFCVVTFITVRFHLQIRIFPLWQMTMTVFALLTIALFLHVLIDGVAGYGTEGLARWPRTLSGALLWPVVMSLLDRVRMQNETRTTSF